MAGIPQRRKTEAGAKLASGFSGVWEVRSKSRKLSPRKMQLKKSLLPSAASTTPGGLGGRWTALFLASTEYRGQRTCSHAPLRPMCASPVAVSSASPRLRFPAAAAAVANPCARAPSPGDSRGLQPPASWPSFSRLALSPHPSDCFGVEDSVSQGIRHNGQKKRKDEKTTKSLGEAMKDTDIDHPPLDC